LPGQRPDHPAGALRRAFVAGSGEAAGATRGVRSGRGLPDGGATARRHAQQWSGLSLRRDHRRRHRQPVRLMTFINYASREINCKIVYYGPGLCGKTTNLQWIYDKVNPNTKGKLISLATETERTLFFDFLPLELGTIRGFKTRFHLYTV